MGETVALRSDPGRRTVVAAVLGSGMAFLDGTVVNVALRQVGLELGAGVEGLQWVVNAYMLTLASLILVGGALGDRHGRRRVFVVGVVWFTVASLACALAQSTGQLVAARALQGVGGALLTPGSLALVQGTIAREDRARAIGIWSAWAGVSTVLGPLVGGWLVQTLSWRWVFLVNLPLAVLVLLAARAVPESVPARPRHFDVAGAVLCVLGLAGVTYALIERSLPAAVLGVLALAAFVAAERWTASAMLPPDLFRSRAFTTSNVVTFVVYGALGAVAFFLVLQLQVVGGYTPLAAGLSTVPLTLLMLGFSARVGVLATRTGPRPLMVAGPAVAAAGVALLAGLPADPSYVRDVLPGMTVFGVGITLLVAPLTTTVLAAVPDERAGIASGVNNAVARAASLLAVAALPALVGLSGDDNERPAALAAGYTAAMWWCVGLLLLGAALATLVPARQRV
nr:MFS transporter [Georgenia muralis]